MRLSFHLEIKPNFLLHTIKEIGESHLLEIILVIFAHIIQIRDKLPDLEAVRKHLQGANHMKSKLPWHMFLASNTNILLPTKERIMN